MNNKSILSVHDRYENRGRRSGNTTRMLDVCIQLLFEGNKIIYITNISVEMDTFLKRLNERFMNEHEATMTQVGNHGRYAHWNNFMAQKRLLFEKYTGLKARGITYFDKDNYPQDIDHLHDTEIAVIIELQTKAEWDNLDKKPLFQVKLKSNQ